jgi:Flp pilus assembly protein TadD
MILSNHQDAAIHQGAEVKSTKKYISTQPNCPSTSEVNAVVTLFNDGRYIEVENFAQELTTKFPLHEFGWKVLAAVLWQTERIKEALKPLQILASMSPSNSDANVNLGCCFHELGRLDEAEVSYHIALKINPNHSAAYNNLGNVLMAQGRFDDAESCYQQALQLKPDFAEAHSNLGNVLREIGRLEDAMLSFRRAIEIKPDVALVHSNMGNGLQELGQFEGAIGSANFFL